MVSPVSLCKTEWGFYWWIAPVQIVVLLFHVIVWKMLSYYCSECLQVNGTEIGWSLGFMIDSSSELPQSKREYYMTNLAFALMMTLFILFILISVGFACHAVKFQRRKQKGKLYQTAPKSDGYGAIQWTSKFRQRISSEMSPPNSDIFVKLFSVKYWLPPEMVFAKN